MVQQSLNVAYSEGSSQVLWEDGERVFSRGWRLDDNGDRLAVLLVALAADHPSRQASIASRTNTSSKMSSTGHGQRPLALVRDAGRTVLVLDDPGGEPLVKLLGSPLEMERFLRSRSASPRLSARSTNAASSTKTSSQPTLWWTARMDTCGSPGSVSHRACPASGRRPSRPRPSPARLPTWRPNKPAG